MRTHKRVDASTRGRLAALASIQNTVLASKQTMNILNYFKAPDTQADNDPITDSSPDAGKSQFGEVNRCSSSLPEVSDSKEDLSYRYFLIPTSEMSAFDKDYINQSFQNTRLILHQAKAGVAAQSGMIFMIG